MLSIYTYQLFEKLTRELGTDMDKVKERVK